MKELRQALKFNPGLPAEKAQKYWKWMKKEGFERHHPFGKRNGYLLVHRKREDHNHGDVKIYANPIGDLIECLANLFKYIKWLEEK